MGAPGGVPGRWPKALAFPPMRVLALPGPRGARNGTAGNRGLNPPARAGCSPAVNPYAPHPHVLLPSPGAAGRGGRRGGQHDLHGRAAVSIAAICIGCTVPSDNHECLIIEG